MGRLNVGLWLYWLYVESAISTKRVLRSQAIRVCRPVNYVSKQFLSL